MSSPGGRGGRKRPPKETKPKGGPSSLPGPDTQPMRRDDRSPLRERFLFLGMAGLVGNLVEVEVKDGTVYIGIFYTFQFLPNGFNVVLRLARTSAEEAEVQKPKPIESFVIPHNQFVRISALEVDNFPTTGFATDSAIGALSGKGQERELVAWVPDDTVPLVLGGLEGAHEDWDQFAVNRQKFDVKSTWDENIYTTPLNVSDPNYKEKAAAAAKLAREIEGKASSNAHIAEERGFDVDQDLDEEARYSEVARTAGRPAGRPTAKAAGRSTPKLDTSKNTETKRLAAPVKEEPKVVPKEAPKEQPRPEPSKVESSQPSKDTGKKLSAAAKEYVPRAVAEPEPEPEYENYGYNDYYPQYYQTYPAAPYYPQPGYSYGYSPYGYNE
jgi:hypothetical protein